MYPVCIHTLFPENIINIVDHIAVTAKIIITMMSLWAFTYIIRYPAIEKPRIFRYWLYPSVNFPESFKHRPIHSKS